ncbi:hypothetical protein QPX51_08115 [Corynebacterium pseudodiphtheriticum]|uniref:hypothetical protein n=1 Tax=Corynebacterium pseudodiphtheriticum TaxID=37637 RepID=UPI001267D9F8|nr:hypothetical protein [Corynebacterium pseudodiphtheriticum]MCG7252852.1 hypothetical protein [Corynebacterium pseudodiphtheriticum]MDK4339945.1 hypothetical protein [Corynebacterium pseudodiphtheriticum]
MPLPAPQEKFVFAKLSSHLCQKRLHPSPSELGSGQVAKSDDIRPIAVAIRHPIAGNHASGNHVYGAFLQIGALKAAFFVHYLQKCTIRRHDDQTPFVYYPGVDLHR